MSNTNGLLLILKNFVLVKKKMYNHNSHSYQYYDQNVCNNYEQDYTSNYNCCQTSGNYYTLNSNLSGNASYDSSSSSSSCASASIDLALVALACDGPPRVRRVLTRSMAEVQEI